MSIAVRADNCGCGREIVVGLGIVAEPRIWCDGLSVFFPSQLLRIAHRLHSVPVPPDTGAGLHVLTRSKGASFCTL